MVINNFPAILYIEPKKAPSMEPIVDMITMKMTAALRRIVDIGAIHVGAKGTQYEKASLLSGVSFRGFHTCSCGAVSGSQDYLLANGYITNDLAIHYLAYHREEVPEFILEEIEKWDFEAVAPTADELRGRILIKVPEI